MRAVLKAWFCMGWVLIVPAFALGQATLGGVVRDSSGAVLPGVTVEASSPVLIEKVRTTVTDGTGQFRIVDLRGGPYTVTFTLGGFSTLKRDAVELAGEASTIVNADLRVGGVTETVTVASDAPLVDITSATRQTVMRKAVIDTLPTSRNYSSFGLLLTGVSINRADTGGAAGDPMASLTIHGSRPGDQRVLQNGVNTMSLQVGGDIGIAVPNPGMASEVTIDTSGVSAEQSQGGVRINYIPRDGGNTFSGSTFATFANSRMQGTNLTRDLVARGLTSANSIKMIYDVNPGFGGPIKQDRMWFYFTGRVNRADQYAGGSYVNVNGYNPTRFDVVEDRTRPGYDRTLWTDAQLRLTTQLTPKNKVAVTWDEQTRCSCPGLPVFDLPWAIYANTSPEASANFRSPTERLVHGEWSSPVTNRLLVEVGGLRRIEHWGYTHPRTADAPDFISPAQEAVLTSGALVPIIDASNGHWSHGHFLHYNTNQLSNYVFRGSVSYVTGGHQIKAGVADVVGSIEQTLYNFSPFSYITNIVPGLPLAVIVENIRPIHTKSNQDYDLGAFVQDRWTVDRLTLNLGVRFDAFKASSPPQHVVGPTPLTPRRPDIDVPETVFNNWKDVTTRLGASYDVTGDGKTAITVSLNKYLQGQTVGLLAGVGAVGGLNPVNRLVNSANRIWFDGNGDFVPQCDLVSIAANGECGELLNPNFGLNDTTALQFSRDLEFGWGKRGYNWEFGAGIQREVLPRVSVDVGYFRRWYGNFTVTDNTALSARDYTQFSVSVPRTAGLSTSTQTITGLFDPNKIVPQANVTTLASEYGRQLEHWNGVDISVNTRLQNGLFLFGGVNAGKTMVDNCDVATKVPESLTTTPLGSAYAITVPLQFCHTETPFLMQAKLNGAYSIPKADVLVSAAFQSVPGPPIRAELAVAERSPGVPLTAGSATVAVIPSQVRGFLDAVSSEYGERLNVLDVRIGKVLRVGKTRTTINLDVFNVLNGHAVAKENSNIGAFRRPVEIALARFVKIGAQFDF